MFADVVGAELLILTNTNQRTRCLREAIAMCLRLVSYVRACRTDVRDLCETQAWKAFLDA